MWTLSDHNKPLSFWEQDQPKSICILTFAFIFWIIIMLKTIKEKILEKLENLYSSWDMCK